MNPHNEQLTDYVRQHLQAGTPPLTVRQSLIDVGWPPNMVDDVFRTFAKQPNSASQGVEHETQPSTEPQATENVPQKYKLFRAIKDAVHAIKANAKAFFVSGIVTAIGALIILFVLDLIVVAILQIGSGGISTVAFILAAIVCLLMTSVTASLLQIMGALCTWDGAEGRQSPLKPLLAKGIHKLPRMILANLLVGIISTGPLILVTLVGITALFSTRDSGTGMTVTFMLLIFPATGWILIALLRYSLAPMVAIFEDVPVRQTLARSRKLLARGGQWFIVKGVGLILLIAILISAAIGRSVQDVQESTNPVVNILLIVVEILTIGTLTMLYRNRKIIKDS